MGKDRRHGEFSSVFYAPHLLYIHCFKSIRIRSIFNLDIRASTTRMQEVGPLTPALAARCSDVPLFSIFHRFEVGSV